MTATTTAQPASRRFTLARRPDSGLLLTLALCAFALWPLLYRPGLPNGNDVLYHVYRTAEMDRAWSHGVFLPRWAESFYTGYGAPVFHYYASLSYTVASLIMRLPGVDALNSLRVLIALCVFGAGAGMYGFARARAGKLGGIIAALCYVYCPYMLFTEPYSRGAYPELAALALFPLVMWRFDRLLKSTRRLNFVLAAISLAALILTHNLMGLVMTGLLVAWLVWETLVYLLTVGRTDLLRYGAALLTAGLGIGLAAYFWLPVILESGDVRLENLTAVAQLDYRNFFVPLPKLLAFSPRFDNGALNGLQHQFNLGVPQWILALTGLIGLGIILLRTRRNQPMAAVGEGLRPSPTILRLLFFVLAGGACILLLLPLAANVWSPLAFLQFPWRFLGPAGFCLAMVAGMNAVWIERLPRHIASIVTAGSIAFIIGLTMPLFYVSEWVHSSVDSSVAAYQQAEVKGLQRATTFSNEYLPKAVQVEPDATESLLADYADGYPVDHLNRETLPDGVTAELLDNGPQHSLWQVNTPAPFTMEALIFDFAGWTAEIDGQVAPITPSDPHGLLTFPVPAGDHTVRVYLGTTPARDLGIAVSVLALLGLIAIAVYVRKGVQLNAPTAVVSTSQLETGNWQLGTLLGGMITLALVLFYMREGVGWVQSPPGKALLAQHREIFHFGEQIDLLGYDLNGETFRAGDQVELSVYWHARESIPYGYASFVHISTGGPPPAQADKQNPAGRPTKEWTSDGYIRDDYTIQLPELMPPDEYQIYVGLYTCDTLPPGECGNGDRLLVTRADGQPVGDALALQTITVR